MIQSDEVKPDDLAGCTFHGVPVHEEVVRAAAEEKSIEIAHVANENVSDIRKAIYRKGLARFEDIERNSRVKILTNDEIRREKGVLAKPFKTNMENLMWLIRDSTARGSNGVTLSVVKHEFGLSHDAAASLLYVVWRECSEPGIINRWKPTTGPLHYRWADINLSVEEAIKSKSGIWKQNKIRDQKGLIVHKGEVKPRSRKKVFATVGLLGCEPQQDRPVPPEPEAPQPLVKRAAPAVEPGVPEAGIADLRQAVGQLIGKAIGKALGIEVSGKIEITIRIVKE
jgi:hypothetical protein